MRLDATCRLALLPNHGLLTFATFTQHHRLLPPLLLQHSDSSLEVLGLLLYNIHLALYFPKLSFFLPNPLVEGKEGVENLGVFAVIDARIGRLARRCEE